MSEILTPDDAKGWPVTLTGQAMPEDKRIVQRSENATFDIPNRGIAIINEYERPRQNRENAERKTDHETITT